MPRFVILIHDHPFPHWDFLLEFGKSCRTWRLLTDPGNDAVEIPAESIADHRLLYLDHQGEVSGGRGRVTRWDAGKFVCHFDRAGLCEVELMGQRWKGVVQMRQVQGERWVCRRDLTQEPVPLA